MRTTTPVNGQGSQGSSDQKEWLGMAFWFSAVNSYLGGKRQQDMLDTEQALVIAAAESRGDEFHFVKSTHTDS
jgi:hypothetical protein